MRTLKRSGRRATASFLAIALIFATVPPVGAREAVLGTITVTGPAFAATSTSDWVRIVETRPAVSGDRLKTGTDGSLLADLGELGIVALYADSEVSIAEQDGDITVDAQRGKVAFHLAPGSPLRLTAGGAAIVAGTQVADGFIEFNEDGAPELEVASDRLNVVLAGGTRTTLSRGDRLALTDPSGAVTTAGAGDTRKAGPLPTKKRSGLSPLTWTAIGGVVVAVGAGVGIGVAGGGGGGGGGGDTNGSPDGE